MAGKRTKEKKVVPQVGQAAELNKLVKQAFRAVIIGVVLLASSIAITFSMSGAQEAQLQVTMALNQYREGSKALTSAVQSYAVTGNSLYYDQYMKELNVAQNREKAIATLQEYDITDDEWAALNEIAGMSEGLVPLEEAAMASVAAGDLNAAQESVFGDAYEDTIVKINDYTDTAIGEIQARKASQKVMLQIIQMAVQAVFVVACGYVIYALVKTIKFSQKELLVPIEKVAEQMGYLAKGDFSEPLDLVEDESEVGQMVSAIAFMKKNINNMIAEISDILGEMSNGNYQTEITQEYVGEFVRIKESIIDIGESMRETLHTLKDVSEQIDAGSEQLACAAQDLAEGSTTQATQVAEVAEAISRMSRSMESNAAAAEESVIIASNAGAVLVAGNEKMQELKVAIGEISKCSEEISTIINAIEDIASQTNLLSLNAAIEAARAGEAGKGFAVVASEIQHLAQESGDSALKITEIVQRLSEDSRNSMLVMKEVMERLQEQQDKLNETILKFQNICEGITSSREHTSQIHTQAQQCDHDRNEMLDIVQNLSAISEENAASTEETTASMQELNSRMTLLTDSAIKLKELAVSLEENTKFFQL